jgi:hypothetical protein
MENRVPELTPPKRDPLLFVGVLKTVCFTDLKTLTAALLMLVMVAAGSGLLHQGTAVGHQIMGRQQDKQPANRQGNAPDSEAEKLVRQLGSPVIADREAAEKALRSMGATAAAAVRTGIGSAELEIARRCATIWPQLWQTEIARPDADRLAGYVHPVWTRFRNTVGDDPGSGTLFAEMLADVRRFTQIETVEADPIKAGDVYGAELKLRVERMKQAYKLAEKTAGGRLGMLWPYGGIPTRGEYAALLFLGTYPATAAVSFREADDFDRISHCKVFGFPLDPEDREKGEDIPPSVRRLFAAWLMTRTDPNPIHFGMNLAIYHRISEVASAARSSAADPKLAPKARGFALLAVGRFGTSADKPLLETAFADARVFYETDHTSEGGQKRPVEVLVNDASIAAALRLSGQHPADFGLPLLEMYNERGSDTLAKYHLLGFFGNDTRQAAHKKAKEWLITSRSDQ